MFPPVTSSRVGQLVLLFSFFFGQCASGFVFAKVVVMEDLDGLWKRLSLNDKEDQSSIYLKR